LGLDVRTTDWIARDKAFPVPLVSPRIAAAVFSDDVLLERHNSELIETGPQQAVVVRIAEHEPSGVLPFEGNKAAIEADYVRVQAAQRAAAAGTAYIGRLQRGETTLAALAEAGAYSLYEPGAVGRGQNDVPPEVLRLAFAMTPPGPGSAAYAGDASAAGDYLLVEMSAVEPGQLGAMTPVERERFSAQIRDALGETELESITRNLRNQAKVEVTPEKTDSL
jgi:peptidyl-prolyl cis-trans isomerase D